MSQLSRSTVLSGVHYTTRDGTVRSGVDPSTPPSPQSWFGGILLLTHAPLFSVSVVHLLLTFWDSGADADIMAERAVVGLWVERVPFTRESLPRPVTICWGLSLTRPLLTTCCSLVTTLRPSAFTSCHLPAFLSSWATLGSVNTALRLTGPQGLSSVGATPVPGRGP